MNNKHSAMENISFMPNLNISFNMNKGTARYHSSLSTKASSCTSFIAIKLYLKNHN